MREDSFILQTKNPPESGFFAGISQFHYNAEMTEIRLIVVSPYSQWVGMAILAVAAASENDNDCKDYNPSATVVVIKKMAKAIVIHVCLPPGVLFCGTVSA